ncbi:hypothetical protein PLS229_10170 [Xylella taiwanensis]|nr:hypothetical protein PLS229_10170 [Xylella taiwanensis]
MNRWAKSGILDRAFEPLQQAQVMQIKIQAVSLDSANAKVHPPMQATPDRIRTTDTSQH